MNKEVENCLNVIQEECAEVIKVISKILRFGFESYHPDDPNKKLNITKLSEEYGDLAGSIRKLEKLCPEFIDNKFWGRVNYNAEKKPEKIDRYYKYTRLINE